jgi:LacI family transcriptional regulator
MRDVARLARVSVATVSAVVNGKSSVRPLLVKRVQNAMRALDYHPDHVARSLKVRKTTTIGVVIPDFASGFFVEVVRGIEDVARTAGYSVLLCNSNDDAAQEQRHLHALFSRRVDGILLASTDPNSVGRREFGRNTPIVLFDRIPPGYEGPAVVIDNLDAAYEATRYLISLGHRKIAFISGRLDLSTGKDRAEGFRKAMEEAHLTIRADYFKRGDFKPGSGVSCALELLRLEEPPSAIFSSNSGMTIGLLQALQQCNVKCPEDVSILGFDDLGTGTEGLSFGKLIKPELTVIAQPGYQIGQRAAGMLLEMLAGPENVDGTRSGEVVTLTANLRVRRSVGGLQH